MGVTAGLVIVVYICLVLSLFVAYIWILPAPEPGDRRNFATRLEDQLVDGLDGDLTPGRVLVTGKVKRERSRKDLEDQFVDALDDGELVSSGNRGQFGKTLK